MRDKNRIRPFCEELARLWEQKPDLRFGQIIASLPYVNKRSSDMFYLEDDEMTEVIHRHFDENPKKKADADKLPDLEMQWRRLSEELQMENEFNTQAFKNLFRDTWQYFINSAGDSVNIDARKIPIICCIAALCGHTDYPEDTNEWDYEACTHIAEAFLGALSNPLRGGYRGNFHDGYIPVTESDRTIHELHISEFDEYFGELSDIFRKNTEE